MPDICDQISRDLHIPRKWVEDALEVAQVSFRVIKIRKHSGGVRTLINPAVETKMIQRWLLIKLFRSMQISPIATAFEHGTSIVKNAHPHRQSIYSVRVDISDFFPSIKFSDLISIMNLSRSELPHWAFDASTLNAINQTCFDRHGRLPIGYPSSPRIANIVMRNIDLSLTTELAERPEEFGKAVLTRYADDFLFSSDLKGACAAFVAEIKAQLAAASSPKLQVNDKKTRLMNRKSGSTFITGLRVKPNGTLGVHAKYRDHVRLLIKLYAERKLKTEDISKLRGHLAFVEHADPALFSKIAFTYYSQIAKIRSNLA
ncbi:MAG: retron St85 family RNA-directed DNA polymerase [Pseudomonadota bacterium]